MKITLLTPVQHDGKAHKEGDTLSMDDAQAQSLMDCGAAEKAGNSRSKSATVQAPEPAPEQPPVEPAAAADPATGNA